MLVYFSHMLILMMTLAVAVLLPLSVLKVEKGKGELQVSNWQMFLTKLKVVVLSMLPALFLGFVYLIKVDSLEEAGRLGLGKLINWIVDIRPMLTLSTSKPWNIFTHILFGIFVLMIINWLIVFIKTHFTYKNKKLSIDLPVPGFNIVWFLLFAGVTFLYLIVPNANILPERLIIMVFIFFGLWLATLDHKKWMQFLFLITLLVIHLTFSISLHTKNMKSSSIQIEKMNEITDYIEPGSLLLPFNYAYQHNWLHMHSPGYFGSDKPIAVVENYEGQLKWFPVNWNLDGPYDLQPINVWAADNRKMIDNFYTAPDSQNYFSLPLKNGGRKEIPYVVVFGKVTNEEEANYKKITSILSTGYSIHYENDFCKLYKLK